jgi:hypothetical protein
MRWSYALKQNALGPSAGIMGDAIASMILTRRLTR